MVDELDRGMCFTCGFVGMRLREHAHILLEATAGRRKDGSLWQGNNQMARPWCIKERRDFIEDVGLNEEAFVLTDPAGVGYRKTVELLLKERACPEWFQYQPFRTPAEHLLDERQVKMEGERRKWQADMEENNRLWDQKLASDRKDWEIKLNDQAECWQRGFRRESRWWQSLTVVVAIVGVIVALRVGG